MPEEIVVGVVIALALLVLVKLGRLLLKLAVLGVVVAGVLCLAEVVECPFGTDPGGGAQPGPPADVEVVGAVYRHVRGKTYVDQQVEHVREWVPCTARDYDLDAFKGDPGRGTCLDYGRHPPYGRKQVTRTVSRPVSRPCPLPPVPSSPEWRVQAAGPERWVVSNAQGRWTVAHLGRRSFEVTTSEPC